MARMARAEVFSPDEVAVVQVMNRVVRRCYPLGDDPVSGKNYDHRKMMIENQLQRLTGAGWHCFGVFGKALVFVFSGGTRSSSGGRLIRDDGERFVRWVAPKRTTRRTNFKNKWWGWC